VEAFYILTNRGHEHVHQCDLEEEVSSNTGDMFCSFPHLHQLFFPECFEVGVSMNFHPQVLNQFPLPTFSPSSLEWLLTFVSWIKYSTFRVADLSTNSLGVEGEDFLKFSESVEVGD
jgi:hypothetical protein